MQRLNCYNRCSFSTAITDGMSQVSPCFMPPCFMHTLLTQPTIKVYFQLTQLPHITAHPLQTLVQGGHCPSQVLQPSAGLLHVPGQHSHTPIQVLGGAGRLKVMNTPTSLFLTSMVSSRLGMAASNSCTCC